MRLLTLGVGILECLLALPLLAYDPAGAAFQFVEKAAWLPALGMPDTRHKQRHKTEDRKSVV